MNQSGVIVGALLLGFVLYLAAKGRFTTYTQVLWGNTSAALPSFNATNAPSALTSNGSSSSALGAAADAVIQAGLAGIG